jgi:hypothetical protein
MIAITALGGPMMPVAMIDRLEMMSRMTADRLLGATAVAVAEP